MYACEEGRYEVVCELVKANPDLVKTVDKVAYINNVFLNSFMYILIKRKLLSFI
jgi:hypothetical protein